MVEYRNIGHEWEFREEQKEKLLEYYNANTLLIECMNKYGYVIWDVREEVESTLLFPIKEFGEYRLK